MYYEYATALAELITTFGFPIAMCLILLLIVVKQNRKFTEAINKNTEAFHALNTSVTVLTAKVVNT